MNRNEKINKLGSAVKAYCGKKDPKTKKWIVHPKPKARGRIIKWVRELDLDVDKSMKKIDKFKKYEQYCKWINGIRESGA